VVGPTVNRRFLKFLIEHPDFAAGDVDTGLIDRLTPSDFADDRSPDADALALASLAIVADRAHAARQTAARRGDPFSPWASSSCWRVNVVAHQDLRFRWPDGEAAVAVTPCKDGHHLHIDLNGGALEYDATGETMTEAMVSAMLAGEKRQGRVIVSGTEITVFAGAKASHFELADPALMAGGDDAEAPVFAAPMPGKVVAVNVKAGDEVGAGMTLIVLEAMKMEHAIKAPVDGRVTAVHYGVGDQVEEGRDLIAFEAVEPEA
jgi:3-methylcrotonyl-CoA carboxylase alpha subunit